MWPFGSRKHKTLSHAVLAGDLRAARKMLAEGADPNKCDPDDDAYPIHYAIHHGAAMVQLLVDHGADVNIPGRGDIMPLALAESQGYADVGAIFRKAGARLRTGREEFGMDPRFRLQLEPKIMELVLMAQYCSPDAGPEELAEMVEGKLNIDFPPNVPPSARAGIQKEVRALIRKECGVKDYLGSGDEVVPSIEEAMRRTGMSEDELTRRFMEHLIKQGKDPFKDMPESLLRDSEQKYPDLVQLARRKFGGHG